ncbi:MAG TPA: DMT family transporter [Ktedonobacterales bacterium]|jgi:drug/metabolite transporter (DMT)-like permease
MARPVAAPRAGEVSGATPARRARPAPTRIYVYLALGILCIAFSAIFTRWAAVPGTVSAFYRMAIAAVALALPFARIQTRQSRQSRQARAAGPMAQPSRPSWRVWALAGATGIFFALDLAFWNTSLFLTSAATATLLGNDAPIIVGLGALLLFRERLGAAYWLGLAVALAGMVIIAGPDVLARSHLGAGDALALTGGAAYGCYLLATQRLRVHLDALSALWVPAVTGAVLLLVFDLAQRQVLWGFSARTYAALLVLGLVIQVGGWLAITHALGHLPAAVVSVTLLAQPVLTALLAVPLLGEALSVDQVIGGVVALAGIYLVNRRGTAPAEV